jgi:hypothetical protein
MQTSHRKPVPVDYTQCNSNGWFYAQLIPQAGTNTLKVSALHPSGQFTQLTGTDGRGKRRGWV